MHRKFSGIGGKPLRLKERENKKSLSKQIYCIGTEKSFMRSKVAGDN